MIKRQDNMLLNDAFEIYIEKNVHLKGIVHTIYLELRRGKIDTVEQLKKTYNKNPEDLLKIRGIGPQSLEIIKDILENL